MLFGWFGLALSLMFALAGASAAVPPVRPIGMVLSLRGELDHLSQVEDVRRALESAKKDGVRLVVIEVRGSAWRFDIARAFSELVRVAEPTVGVFVADSALGVALAGAQASGGCWAPGDLTLEQSDNAIELTPGPKPINDDAKAWAKADGWSALAKHEALRAAIIDPRKACWLIQSTSGEITTSEKEPDDSIKKDSKRALLAADPAHGRLRLSVGDAVALGIIAGEARGAADAVKAAAARLGLVRIDVRETREVGQELSQRHKQVAGLLDQVPPLLDAAEQDLDLGPRSVVVGPAIKNAAGQRALGRLRDVSEMITQAESLLVATPEIMRFAAPGRPTALQQRSAWAAKWRSQMQALRTRHDRIEQAAISLRDAR